MTETKTCSIIKLHIRGDHYEDFRKSQGTKKSYKEA